MAHIELPVVQLNIRNSLWLVLRLWSDCSTHLQASILHDLEIIFIICLSCIKRFLFHYLLLCGERVILSLVSFSVYFLSISKERGEERNGKI